AYSYLYGGINVALPDRKGRALLLVDASIADAISSELSTFVQDLLGAGWSPLERRVERSASPAEVKEIIRSEYNLDQPNFRSIILVGHVPVPYSGNLAPDLHESHKGAWPADVYYADMNGLWTDSTVSVTSEDFLENFNFPGDGKFDQSDIPAAIQLEIGRIDFWEMPAFAPRSETDLLKTYFRKNHEFRHRIFTAVRRGLVHDNFGDLDGDAPAVDAWRWFSPFFGRGTLQEVGPDQFFPTLDQESYLWAYGCGGGGNLKADGVGSTADFAARNPQAVFLALHGSYFGDWNYPDNFLRAAIATPRMTLASIWSGIPHWYMHHMGLGSTVGYSTRITQNNRGEYKSYRNFSPGQVHISLLGDPTLELFPVMPPANLSAAGEEGVRLRWSPSLDENIVAYRIYHSGRAIGPYSLIVEVPPGDLSYLHATVPGLHFYMVRAVKLEKTGSGTFYNLSQGIFAEAVVAGQHTNQPPIISGIPDQTVVAGSESVSTSIMIADFEKPAEELSLRAVSLNPDLLPESAVILGGGGTTRSIQVKAPAGRSGIGQVRIVVSDGELETSSEFKVNVLAEPVPPVLRAITLGPNLIQLQFSGQANHSFRVEISTDAVNWTVISGGVSDVEGSGEFQAIRDAARMKLYRIQWP
ncbi:MAG TPA: hypothetical protein VK633_08955, partial [Verrucomicrobiae bacterium]|nr:hypothetical protein [Verrucomicrobiae bacterium]